MLIYTYSIKTGLKTFMNCGPRNSKTKPMASRLVAGFCSATLTCRVLLVGYVYVQWKGCILKLVVAVKVTVIYEAIVPQLGKFNRWKWKRTAIIIHTFSILCICDHSLSEMGGS